MKRAILLALMLAGCQTTEQAALKDDTQCRSYGVAPGTQPYVDCRMRLDQQRADQRQINSLSPGSFLLGTMQEATK